MQPFSPEAWLTMTDPQQSVGILQAVVQRIRPVGNRGEQRERANYRECSITESLRPVAKAGFAQTALAFGRRGPDHSVMRRQVSHTANLLPRLLHLRRCCQGPAREECKSRRAEGLRNPRDRARRREGRADHADPMRSITCRAGQGTRDQRCLQSHRFIAITYTFAGRSLSLRISCGVSPGNQ